MDEQQKSASTENALAQAYGAYMIALASRKQGRDQSATPDLPEVAPSVATALPVADAGARERRGV